MPGGGVGGARASAPSAPAPGSGGSVSPGSTPKPQGAPTKNDVKAAMAMQPQEIAKRAMDGTFDERMFEQLPKVLQDKVEAEMLKLSGAKKGTMTGQVRSRKTKYPDTVR